MEGQTYGIRKPVCWFLPKWWTFTELGMDITSLKSGKILTLLFPITSWSPIDKQTVRTDIDPEPSCRNISSKNLSRDCLCKMTEHRSLPILAAKTGVVIKGTGLTDISIETCRIWSDANLISLFSLLLNTLMHNQPWTSWISADQSTRVWQNAYRATECPCLKLV